MIIESASEYAQYDHAGNNEMIGGVTSGYNFVFTARTYGRFAMEVILTSAFGVQVDTQNNPDDVYTKHVSLVLAAGPPAWSSYSVAGERLLFPLLVISK